MEVDERMYGRKRILMRRMRADTGGQSALIDAFLFFLIMVLASVFINLPGQGAVEDVVLRKDDLGYARDALGTLLRCTVNRTNYTAIHEGKDVNVELVHLNAAELMVEDIVIRSSGMELREDSIRDGLEEPIRELLDNLTSCVLLHGGAARRYDYHLSCEYGNVSFSISSAMSPGSPPQFPLERFSSEKTIHMPSGENGARVILLLWPSSGSSI